MKRTFLLFAVVLQAAPVMLIAQCVTPCASIDPELSRPHTDSLQAPKQNTTRSQAQHVKASPATVKPLSRIALGGGVSSLGIQMQMAINLSSHFNARGIGYLDNYSTNFTTNGISANAKLNMASGGAALDIYPFHAGFRLSPGVLFYNQNQLSATSTIPSGTSFTLNGETFYSANVNGTTGMGPVYGNGTLGLNTNKTAFTATTGWGNMIPKTGRHWSVPFEIGVVFVGAPSVNVKLGGWVCLDQKQTQCSNIADTTNPVGASAQAALKAQVARWTSDLDPLKTYPIVSIGLAYNFRIR